MLLRLNQAMANNDCCYKWPEVKLPKSSQTQVTREILPINNNLSPGV